MMGGVRVIAAGLALLAAAWAGPLAAKPQRIVSLNLCTDQLLLQLVERSRIASVTFLVADPTMSAMAEEVGDDLRLNHGLAEEILPLEPDLVLARTFTVRATVDLLRRLGYPVVEVPPALDLEDIRSNIRTVAAAVGEPDRGAALIAAFDARLARLPPRTDPAPVAAHYWANSYTSGRETLVETMIEAAGFDNLASRLGLSGAAKLPLEVLLRESPDLLVIGGARSDAPALASEILSHPALRRAFAGRPQVVVPDRMRACGMPSIVAPIERLAAARAALRGQQGD